MTKRTEYGTIDLSHWTCPKCRKNLIPVKHEVVRSEPLTTWDCPDYLAHREAAGS